MMMHPLSKMKGSLFSVVLLVHIANAHMPSVPKMEKITIYKCAHRILWFFLAIFVVFLLPPLPDLLLQQLGDDDADAGTPRAPLRPPPTIHQTTYIPDGTHEDLRYVQHCSSESGSLLTTFRVLGLHARQQHHGPSSLIHAHDGPSSLID
jgi:hypothetical protein